MSKYIKLNAIIEMPDDMAELDVMNFLTDTLEEHNCEWCAGMSYDKCATTEDNNNERS